MVLADGLMEAVPPLMTVGDPVALRHVVADMAGRAAMPFFVARAAGTPVL
jgi:hypothetical protein